MQKKTQKGLQKARNLRTKLDVPIFPFFSRKQVDLLEKKTANKIAFVTSIWLRYLICHLEFKCFQNTAFIACSATEKIKKQR